MLDGKNQWTTYLLHEAPVQRGQLISSCWDYPFEQMQFSIQFKKKKIHLSSFVFFLLLVFYSPGTSGQSTEQ